ncbi:MAG: GIY-YIG nuclease family protein [Bacteroidota bacterium]
MATNRLYYVYIMTNPYNTVLYTGVTNDLERRIREHRNQVNPYAFTAKYNIQKLVWYECYPYIEDAIAREKQIKAGSRKKKIALIEISNKNWRDLKPAKL